MDSQVSEAGLTVKRKGGLIDIDATVAANTPFAYIALLSPEQVGVLYRLLGQVISYEESTTPPTRYRVVQNAGHNRVTMTRRLDGVGEAEQVIYDLIALESENNGYDAKYTTTPDGYMRVNVWHGDRYVWSYEVVPDGG